MAPRSDVPKVNPIITEGVRRWQASTETEDEQRKAMLSDLDFLDLNQWPANLRALRNEQGRERPTLTLDQVTQPWRELKSQQQRSNTAIRVVPESGDANKETADITQGLIRAIEYQCDARSHYGQAFGYAIGPGRGFLRLRNEFENPKTFDQRIVIESIENPFSVYPDPAAKAPDWSDMRYCLITEDVPAEEYNRRFPHSEAAKLERRPNGEIDYRRSTVAGRTQASLSKLVGIGDEIRQWFPGGSIRIAEYYWIDEEQIEIVQLSNGTCIAADELEEYLTQVPPDGEPIAVEASRTSTIPRVKWALINALEILEGDDAKKDGRTLPGSTIPVRPMFGEVLNVNGKRTMRGIVRAAQDAQRMYNYNNSALTEDVALAPKPPIMGAVGQFETARDQWEQANNRAYPYIEYDPVAVGGEMVGPPGRPPGPDPAKIQALVLSIQQNKSDLRTGTGWYDSTDPSRANSEQSGKAIAARKLQQEQTGLAFQDNYRQTLVSLGKLLLEWIPVIYDRPGRIVQTLGLEEGAEPQWAMIGQPFIRGANGQPMPVGQQLTHPQPEAPVITYDPSKAIYGVRVTIGASHETRRQEAAATMGQLIEAQPQLINVIGDLFVRNLDIPDANEIADRIARTIPPHLLAEKDEQNLAGLPDKAKQQLIATQQQVQQLQQELQAATEMLETDQQKRQSQIEVEAMRQQGESIRHELTMALEHYKIQMQTQIATLKAEIEAAKVQATIDSAAASHELAESQQELERGQAVLDGATAGASGGSAATV